MGNTWTVSWPHLCKLTVNNNIHEIIDWLASPGILEDAKEKTNNIFATVISPHPAQESLSKLNQCAQGLQKTDKTGFNINFKNMILLIETVRITHQYILSYYLFIFLNSNHETF